MCKLLSQMKNDSEKVSLKIRNEKTIEGKVKCFFLLHKVLVLLKKLFTNISILFKLISTQKIYITNKVFKIS